MIRRSALARLGLAILALLGVVSGTGSDLRAQDDVWPRRVLITNDDGIDSRAVVELARAFAEFADTYLAAPAVDRSGTTNYAGATLGGGYEVEETEFDGVTAWTVDGYPADCVLFALIGPLRDDPPDLVISGVNTGPNVAGAWMFSGTLGAARMATYFGVPSIAVSGIDNDDPEAVRAIVAWVVALARSEAARRLKPPQYLTVDLPVGPASAIQGWDLADRATGGLWFGSTIVELVPSVTDEEAERPGWTRWSTTFVRREATPPLGSDVAALASGRIAIQAMRVDESDPEMQRWLEQNMDVVPEWPRPEER